MYQTSRTTGYNLFCKELNSEEGVRLLTSKQKFVLYGSRWAALTTERRREFRRRAAQKNTLSHKQRQGKWNKCVKKMLKVNIVGQKMHILRCYLVVSLLLYSTCTDAGGSCQEKIYLEVGKQGVVSCHFEDYDIIGWIHGTGDVTSTSPFIYLEGSQIYGRGYRSGGYDMHPNGSLIINDVKLENEFNYTVLFVPSGGSNEYFKVPVKVYVPPDPWHPVVNGLTNQQQVVIHGIGSGSITCSMAGVRPKVDLEWVASPDEITLDGTPTVTNNSDGTYDVSLNSKFRVLSGAVGNVILMCRATGHKADNFTSETEVYLLNQDEISLETTSSRSNNNDGTFNIKCSSHFGFLRRSMERVTLECRVFDRITNTSLDVTTVELFLPEYQESDCTSQWSPGLNTVILLLMNVVLIGFITLKRTLKRKAGSQ